MYVACTALNNLSPLALYNTLQCIVLLYPLEVDEILDPGEDWITLYRNLLFTFHEVY